MLTDNDLNNLAKLIQGELDKQLDEKLDPIIKSIREEFNELNVRLQSIDFRLDCTEEKLNK